MNDDGVMTKEWIIRLRAEIRQMIQQAVDASPFGFIVAIEQDQDHEKGISDRGGNHERPCDDSRT
jgi:hypothetical protein